MFLYFSPFQQRVTPSADASKVRVGGPGVNPDVSASLPVTFTIDCTDAGVADLEVTIQVRIFFDVKVLIVIYIYLLFPKCS